MREKFWELAGSKIGNLLKVEEKKEKQGEKIEEGHDYRAESQYSKIMSKKIEAVSEFAKSKTLQEQKEFLPIFSVKQELMTVI